MDVAGAGSGHRSRGRSREADGPDAPPPQPTYRSLAAPVASPVDKFALLPAFLKVRGLVKKHIESFNYFITKGMENIVKANDRIEALEDPSIYLRYTGIRVGVPSMRSDFICALLLWRRRRFIYSRINLLSRFL